jgi:hypothetical protein
MLRWLLLILVAAVVACGGPLPSKTPLGTGPLAEVEVDEEAGGDARRAPGADSKARSASTEEPSAPAESDESDQGKEGADEPTAKVKAEQPDPSAAATDASPAESEPVVFVGRYSGEDTTTLRIDGMPERQMPDPNAKIDVERESDQEVKIIIIDSNTGDPFCSLLAETSGNVATITPDQSCPDSGQGGSMTGTVTSGTATVTGTRLVIDLAATIQLDYGNRTADGSLDYHFEGERQ